MGGFSPPYLIGGIYLINETEKIGVLNYNENRVSIVVSPNKSYSFDPSSDGETPTVIPMTFDEIRYANNYNAFRNGMLFFDSSREAEIYEALNITDWKNILHNSDIREIILHPTYEGLSKLIAIKDTAQFERVRAAYHKLKFENEHDISVRVEQIINTRYKELLNRQVNTSIRLTKTDIPTNVPSAEVEALKEQNRKMQEQLEKMQEMMTKMMSASQTSQNSADEHTIPSVSEPEVKKKTGRPSTKKE